ncbi:hypothetical protein QQ045_011604 [Rhodiola kirilowii]
MDAARQLVNVRNGALVLQVIGNGSAFKAGLRPTTRGFAGNDIMLGDIIVAVDDKFVRNKAELDKVLEEYGQGRRRSCLKGQARQRDFRGAHHFGRKEYIRGVCI